MTDFQILKDDTEISPLLQQNKAVLIYFSSNSCVVGEALHPKIIKMTAHHFPELQHFFVDIHSSPKLAASFQAFVEPTVLVFFEGKEFIRKSRNIGLFELQNAIQRPYQLIFE